MTDHDPLLDLIRAAGAVAPPPDPDAALETAMGAIRPARRIPRRLVVLAAAAVLSIPSVVLAARGTTHRPEPAPPKVTVVDDATPSPDEPASAATREPARTQQVDQGDRSSDDHGDGADRRGRDDDSADDAQRSKGDDDHEGDELDAPSEDQPNDEGDEEDALRDEGSKGSSSDLGDLQDADEQD